MFLITLLRLPPVISQINPVQVLPSCFVKIHFNVVLPFTPRSSKLFFSSGYLSPSMLATCPALLIILDLITLIKLGRLHPDSLS